MRKLKKKNVLLACLSLSLVAGTAGAFAINNQTASANTTTLAMENGASLYLGGETTGLKFSFTDSAYAENADYGMLIVANDMLEAAQTALANSEITGVNADDYVNLLAKAQEEGVFNENDKYINVAVAPNADGVFSHSVGNLNGFNYVREFIGIGYKVTGENTYDYATLNNNVRSVFEVANLALNANVYDGGDLDGNGELDAEEQAEKAKIDENETDVKAYVSKGLSFVYGDWDGKAEDYNKATLELTLSASYVDADRYLEVEPTVSTAKTKEIDLKMHWRADTKTATRGKAQPTDIMLADVATVEDVSVNILKDKDEYDLYKTYYRPHTDHLSVTNTFFNDYVNANTKGDGALKLSGGRWQKASDDSGMWSPSYVAFKNNNADDGQFTLEKGKGWYTEFYFKGNNMPLVEFFATNISTRQLGHATYKATGYMVSNGVAQRTDYPDKVAEVMAKEGNINDTSVAATSSFYIAGITQYTSIFRYGVSAYGNFDNGNLTKFYGIANEKNARTYDGDDTNKTTWNLRKNGENSTLDNCSLFSQMGLIMNGTNGTDGNGNYLDFTDEQGNLTTEKENWHYVVGMYLDENNQVWIDSKLYKVNDDGSETEWATMNKALVEGALAEGTVRKGYISVYGCMKGARTNYTYLAYKKPYEKTIGA